MISLRQKELSDWQDRNFGNSSTCKSEWCAIGMAEELGELSHWYLKRKQGIREGARGGNFKKEIADAFADMVVYGIQAMSDEGIDVEEAFSVTVKKVLARNWKDNSSGVGESQHKQLEV